MDLSKILSLLFTAYSLYASDKAQLDAGQPVTTPRVQVGTEHGKPLYATLTLTT